MRQMHLVRIAEVTEIQFTAELVDVAVQCLIEMAKEIEAANASAGTPGNESEKRSKTTAEGSADKDDSHKEAPNQCATAQGSSKSTSTTAGQSQGATASLEGSASKKENEPTKDSTRSWITRFLKEGHDLLWPTGLTPTTGPTLLTGVKMGESDHLIDNLMEWERKF